ncbi:MAG: aminopeptidase P family protein [Ignavibacteria bacterium]|nr:aminopeptidase P family protein [Ignavibacteria bacterium]
MRKIEINSSFFTRNRKNLASLMKDNSCAVINSNDIMPSNADGSMKFIQNSDLFYLTGIEQEETALLLNPSAKNPDFREILFIRDHNPDLEVWEGKKYSPEEASLVSGIESVMGLSRFYDVLHDILCNTENVYLNTNDHDRASNEVETRDMRFIRQLMKKYPLHNYFRISPLLYSLRAVKAPEEVELLQHACDLTGKGFNRVLKFVKPGVWEYEIEAEFAHEFISAGSRYADYEPIIASGESSCFLHYISNDKQCMDGDVLLLDLAAGWGNYNADMTRTIPVNGRFTKRQKDIYNAVLRAMKGTIAEMKPGKTAIDIHMVTKELLARELVDLKLVKPEDVKNLKKKSAAFKKYYPHEVSHFLGLAVHDVGIFDEPLKPGMVLTCEPGIYIREEKIGIRIENDILITENGNIDLMKSIPVEADEIEDIMNSR